MTNIPAAIPMQVLRGGATAVWSSLGTTPLCGGYDAGVSGRYIRYQLQPSATIGILPDIISVTIDREKVEGDLYCDIQDVYAGLGDSSGILTANVATNSKITSGTIVYDIPTAGITLADLNSDAVYFWFAADSDPLTDVYSSGWTLDIDPTSPQQDLAAVPGTATVTDPFVVTPTRASDEPDYVILELDTYAIGTGNGGAASWVGSASADDGEGNTDSGIIESPSPVPPPDIPIDRQAGSTVQVRVNLPGTYSVDSSASCTLSSGGVGVQAEARTELTAAVIQPDTSTLRINSLSADYVPIAPISGSLILPPYAFGGTII